MERNRNLSLVVVGFTAVIALMVGTGLVAAQKTDNLAELGNKIYYHPLAVSTALFEASADVIAMHRYMREVATARNVSDLEQALAEVNKVEEHVLLHLETVRSRFLGEKSRIAESRRIFEVWETIRNEVIELARAGKLQEAVALTKGKGAAQVAKIEANLNDLIDFAQNKATEFNELSGQAQKEIVRFLYGVVSFSIAISVFIAGAVGFLIFRHDRERKLSEEQLRSAHDGLERLVKIRTASLQRSNAELEQFAYVASHDLRAPLRAIKNLVKLLVIDLGESLSEHAERHLALMVSRADRMQGLLDGLLQYSRIGRTEGEVSETDSGGIVKDIVSLLDLPKTWSVKVEGAMPSLETLRVPLEMVFRNLIDNAVKHNDSGSGIISVSAADQGKFFAFSVHDDGPGIPLEFQDRVFGIFQTLKPRDELEGSGMGLALVKKTIEHLGGEISVVSDPQKARGTTFTFTWPKAIA